MWYLREGWVSLRLLSHETTTFVVFPARLVGASRRHVGEVPMFLREGRGVRLGFRGG